MGKWFFGGAHFPKYYTEGIDIGLDAIAQFKANFGCHITWGAASIEQLGCGVVFVSLSWDADGKPKIEEFEYTVLIKSDIGGLEVAEDNVFGVLQKASRRSGGVSKLKRELKENRFKTTQQTNKNKLTR